MQGGPANLMPRSREDAMRGDLRGGEYEAGTQVCMSRTHRRAVPQQRDSQGHNHRLCGSWARLPAAREPRDSVICRSKVISREVEAQPARDVWIHGMCTSSAGRRGRELPGT